MTLKEKLLKLMNTAPDAYYSVKRLVKKLDITQKEEVTAIEKAVEELLYSGEIVFVNSKKFVLLKASELYKGTISGNAKGFAFFRPEEEGMIDLFIPNKNLNGAFDGDTVLCGFDEDEDENSDVGYVQSILKRGKTQIVGTLQLEKNCAFVIADDNKYHADIYIAKSNISKAKNGMKVVAEITSYPKNKKNPEGKIIEILGREKDVGVDVLSIVRSHNIKDDFEIETKLEASRVPTFVDMEKYKNRRDFRGIQVITIDGEDARDLDDAISIKRLNDGNFELGVHIADVTEYVKENSAIDKEGVSRATSVYFVDRVIPMLPKELSNGICSLNEGVERLTLSCLMTVNGGGKVLSYEIVEGVIKSNHRMTYNDVTKILEGDEILSKKYSDILPMLKDMETLAKILIDKRENEGTIDFETPEAKIILNDNGKVVDIKKYERGLSNRIIEEFMILANKVVAENMSRLELPCVYRIHEEPDGEKMSNFVKFVNTLGIKFVLPKNGLRSKILAQLLKGIEDENLKLIVNRVLLRSMKKAKYSPECLGHFGLSAEFYCHFTSPIRRYPDLFTHRMIKKMLAGTLDENTISVYDNIAEEVSRQSSEKEREADLAERESDDLKKTEYMATKIGETFDGVISGVTEFGIFVELENTCEGLIRQEYMPKDNYQYLENMFTLKGAKNTYKLGQKVKIIVAGADVSAKKVAFGLVD